MKISFILLIFIGSISLASTVDIQRAKKYEKEGNYKAAMQIYKKLYESKDEAKNTYYENLDKTADSKTNSSLKQILTKNFNLYPYKKNYFLPITYDSNKKDDRKKFETKFQFSIQKPIVHNFLGLNETISFGYTQKSFWQTTKDSAPFRETNYMPEIFLKAPVVHNYLKGYKVSFIHESNGRDEQNSRSWNRIYLQSYLQFDELFVIPKVWSRIPEDKKNDDNPNIEDYYGYGDLKLVYPYKKHLFELTLKNNLKFDEDNKTSAKFDYTFPLTNSNQDTFGYLQIFHGYGDSLIDYDKKINRIGFGISLSR